MIQIVKHLRQTADKKSLSGFNLVSFKQSDDNYVGKGSSIIINA